MKTLISFALLGVLLSSCAPITKAPPAASTPLPETHAILLVNGALPPSVQYETVGPLEVRLPPPGNIAAFQKARKILAAEARKAGANAVIRVSTTYRWTLAGWTTFGTGTAIRIPENTIEQVTAVPQVQGERNHA